MRTRFIPLMAGTSGETMSRHPSTGRAIKSLAGFCPGEAEVQALALRLARAHGLQPSQLVRLGPDDAAPARFAGQARRWSGDRPSPLPLWAGHRPAAMALGALLAAGPAAAWAWGAVGHGDAIRLLVPTAALLAGLLAGAALGRRGAVRPQRLGRFEHSIQRQLAAGHWALVVHGLPPGRQAGVVAMVRAGSLRWCAVEANARRL